MCGPAATLASYWMATQTFALFVTVSFRWLFVIFFLDSNALDDIASTYSEMCVVYYLFWFVNK